MADDKRFFGSADADYIMAEGKVCHKKPSVVYLLQVPGDPDECFTIDTREGQLTSPCGSYVAYDPKSGDVWPIAADYVAMHYAEGEFSTDSSTDPSTVHTEQVPAEHGFHVVSDAGRRFLWREWVDPKDDKHHLVVQERDKTVRL